MQSGPHEIYQDNSPTEASQENSLPLNHGFLHHEQQHPPTSSLEGRDDSESLRSRAGILDSSSRASELPTEQSMPRMSRDELLLENEETSSNEPKVVANQELSLVTQTALASTSICPILAIPNGQFCFFICLARRVC